MSFSIVERAGYKPRLLWVPVNGTDTLYVGQIVTFMNADGAVPLGAASGAGDTTGEKRVFGIVTGTNYKDPVYNATWKAHSITGIAAAGAGGQADKEKWGMEGTNWAKGDTIAAAQVELLTQDTVIEGPLNNAAYGTAPSLLTVTVASADGGITAPTTNACDFTPVAKLCTMYCRTGANAGLWRITTDTSTTQPTVTHAFKNAAIAVGDTFVRAPFKLGQSFIQLDAESMYVLAQASPATNYFIVNVVGFDLSEAGKEKVRFSFDGDHFHSASA